MDMKKIFRFILVYNALLLFLTSTYSQNVGIGIISPEAKLHIKGGANVSQLIIDANGSQSNTNPFIKLRSSDGIDLMWIHSDSPLNTFIGHYAGHDNNPDGIFGFFNTFVGSSAGTSNTFGNYNTAAGTAALYNNTIGNNNTSLGSYALSLNTSASQNTAIGTNALYTQSYSNGGGAWLSGNVAVGYEALYSNQPASAGLGINNTAVGNFALKANTTGYSNVANGSAALYSNTTGFENTGTGQGALYFLASGGGNTAIGFGSGTGSGAPNVNGTISIGNNGYLNITPNYAMIGNLSTTWTGGNTTWYTYASDARVKNNVNEDVQGLHFISRLRPVTYTLDIHAMREITGNQETSDYPEKYDVEKIRQSGFLAQEVEQAAEESGYSFNGITIPKNENELYTMSYSLFVVPLVKAVQELNEKLMTENEKLTQRIERLEAILGVKE